MWLRFRDIQVVPTRDTEGEPHKLVLQFTLEFTKMFLGIKDAKTFTVPETLFDLTLLLGRHAFPFGISFRRPASSLADVDIHPAPLFRRAAKTRAGLEIMTIRFSLRYNEGNELNGSPYASDAIRSLALEHASLIRFQKDYLRRQLSSTLRPSFGANTAAGAVKTNLQHRPRT